jgi:hypothetical protein
MNATLANNTQQLHQRPYNEPLKMNGLPGAEVQQAAVEAGLGAPAGRPAAAGRLAVQAANATHRVRSKLASSLQPLTVLLRGQPAAVGAAATEAALFGTAPDGTYVDLEQGFEVWLGGTRLVVQPGNAAPPMRLVQPNCTLQPHPAPATPVQSSEIAVAGPCSSAAGGTLLREHVMSCAASHSTATPPAGWWQARVCTGTAAHAVCGFDRSAPQLSQTSLRTLPPSLLPHHDSDSHCLDIVLLEGM